MLLLQLEWLMYKLYPIGLDFCQERRLKDCDHVLRVDTDDRKWTLINYGP